MATLIMRLPFYVTQQKNFLYKGALVRLTIIASRLRAIVTRQSGLDLFQRINKQYVPRDGARKYTTLQYRLRPGHRLRRDRIKTQKRAWCSQGFSQP